MSDNETLATLKEIRNWIRASSFSSVKVLLEAALPDSKSRIAYQMFDGVNSRDQIRVACKMSPNSLSALGQRCTAMGLMEENPEKKRIRLFDLSDFGLIDDHANESEK